MSRAVMQREREALVAYLADCDANSIQPDVGGAWHAAFVAGAALAQRGEPVAKNQCGETCDRSSLCLACGLELNGREAAVARVRVNTTGGNAGLAWSAVPTDDAPHMRDGDLLYAAPQPAPVAQPLTEEQIEVIIGDSDGRWNDGEFRIDGAGLVELINAVERAHGIGSKE